MLSRVAAFAVILLELEKCVLNSGIQLLHVCKFPMFSAIGGCHLRRDDHKVVLAMLAKSDQTQAFKHASVSAKIYLLSYS